MTTERRLLATLAGRFELDSTAIERLDLLAQRSVSLEISGTALHTREDAMRFHIADSLAGLELAAIRAAEDLVDIGSGVGFPGLVLAIARPDLSVTLVDSVRKKTEAAAEFARELGLGNVETVWSRVEDFSAIGGSARESFDVVSVRALASLPVLVEYAAPLLRVGGTLAAWKGDPPLDELADARAATAALGFAAGELIATTPFTGSRRRHFYVAEKLGRTPERFPRRAGTARRKPIKA
ncbi:MAG: 16S rRNA (guanine(527)-N(7))-methyltransferase RsmG [Solirubrobacterales bacterium]